MKQKLKYIEGAFIIAETKCDGREREIMRCASKMVKQLETELAEIERLKLTTGELTGAFNARPKCEKCEHKDQLIEQMRKALMAWTRTPNIPLHEAIKITNAALEAVEGIDNRAE